MTAPIIGIDPGLTGAVALLGAGTVRTWSAPVLRDNRLNRSRLDGPAVCKLIQQLRAAGARDAVIEQVGGLPGQSAAAAFVFGQIVGQLIGACDAAGLLVHRVSPVVWRARLGVRSLSAAMKCDTKSGSIAMADYLWPDDAHQWSTKSRADHAEAALMAEYGRRYLATCPRR